MKAIAILILNETEWWIWKNQFTKNYLSCYEVFNSYFNKSGPIGNFWLGKTNWRSGNFAFVSCSYLLYENFRICIIKKIAKYSSAVRQVILSHAKFGNLTVWYGIYFLNCETFLYLKIRNKYIFSTVRHVLYFLKLKNLQNLASIYWKVFSLAN